jgi:apolipoprotein N-acyltransferase
MSRLPPRWTALALSLAAGLAAGFAHPPFGFLPGLLGFALLMRLVDDAAEARPLRSAFWRGWLAGVGYFAVGVWWVTEPFQVDPSQTWMAPFALILLAGGLALFWGGAAALYRWSRPGGVLRGFVFAGALSALEWARGHVLTGFPWNLPGEAWAAGSPPSQAAAVVGAYGLTWLTVSLAATPALAFDRGTGRLRRLAPLAVAAAGLAALYGAGAWRLQHARPLAEPQPVVRIVQADIDQKDKWRPENLPQIVSLYASLSQAPAKQAPAVVIWPEGALPAVINDLLTPGSPYVELIAEALEPGQTLMMGANRAALGAAGQTQYFNSLVALRRDGAGLAVSGAYDKWRLVPFGEFLPAGELASQWGVRSLVHMPDDFTPGPFPRPMTVRGLPTVQPLICYEALFPGLSAKAAKAVGLRPRWIVNVSNDAWFGATSGPLQHLNMARYRAIEEGLPVIRATPTGVSAIIDPFGRIRSTDRLGLGEMGTIDAPLPRRLRATLYSRFAETAFGCMLAFSALCVCATRFVRRRLWRRLGSPGPAVRLEGVHDEGTGTRPRPQSH